MTATRETILAGMIQEGPPGRYIATAGESSWVVTDGGLVDPYGRPTPAGRRYWTQYTGGGTIPPQLAGIVGFYSATLGDVAATLAGVAPSQVAA